MITVMRYSENLKDIWDRFVKLSKNGTFMLERDYMDYHSDRFVDNSLMFYKDDKLFALLPASLNGGGLFHTAVLHMVGLLLMIT